MRSIKKTSHTSLLLNGAAILLVIGSVGVVLRSVFVGEQAEPCKDRSARATRLSFERNGQPISAEQLQGDLANTDWGLTSRARVISVTSGPATYALELDLTSAPRVATVSAAERAGIGFEWTPQSFGRQKSACLSYSAFVPAGFAFGKGGRLPGFLGASSDWQDGITAPLSTRYTWAVNGDLDVTLQLADASGGYALKREAGTFALTPGKWTELQQEIVLNEPGKSDGVLRVWQDGRLALERKNVSFRTKPSVLLSGILAEAAAGTEITASGGSQKILLTPFELSWN